jgi:hypothetical protein
MDDLRMLVTLTSSSWFGGLFIVAFVVNLVIVLKADVCKAKAVLRLLFLSPNHLIDMPVWTLFTAIGVGAAAIIPMGFVYAISGFQVEV